MPLRCVQTVECMMYVCMIKHYTVSKKTTQNYSCQNLGKFPPILIIFDK